MKKLELPRFCRHLPLTMMNSKKLRYRIIIILFLLMPIIACDNATSSGSGGGQKAPEPGEIRITAFVGEGEKKIYESATIDKDALKTVPSVEWTALPEKTTDIYIVMWDEDDNIKWKYKKTTNAAGNSNDAKTTLKQYKAPYDGAREETNYSIRVLAVGDGFDYSTADLKIVAGKDKGVLASKTITFKLAGIAFNASAETSDSIAIGTDPIAKTSFEEKPTVEWEGPPENTDAIYIVMWEKDGSITWATRKTTDAAGDSSEGGDTSFTGAKAYTFPDIREDTVYYIKVLAVDAGFVPTVDLTTVTDDAAGVLESKTIAFTISAKYTFNTTITSIDKAKAFEEGETLDKDALKGQPIVSWTAPPDETTDIYIVMWDTKDASVKWAYKETTGVADDSSEGGETITAYKAPHDGAREAADYSIRVLAVGAGFVPTADPADLTTVADGATGVLESKTLSFRLAAVEWNLTVKAGENTITENGELAHDALKDQPIVSWIAPSENTDAIYIVMWDKNDASDASVKWSYKKTTAAAGDSKDASGDIIEYEAPLVDRDEETDYAIRVLAVGAGFDENADLTKVADDAPGVLGSKTITFKLGSSGLDASITTAGGTPIKDGDTLTQDMLDGAPKIKLGESLRKYLEGRGVGDHRRLYYLMWKGDGKKDSDFIWAGYIRWYPPPL